MDEVKNTNSLIIFFLAFVSLLILLFSIYLFGILEFAYGNVYGVYSIRVNSSSQNTLSNNTLALSILSTLSLLRISIDMSIIAVISAIIIFGSSLFMFKNRKNILNSEMKRYTPINLAFSILFAIINILLFQEYQFSSILVIAVILFTSIIIAIDIELEYVLHQKNIFHKRSKIVAINPKEPYGNLIKLKEEIFSKMYGNVFIVDRHFDTVAIKNLYRLIEGNQNIKQIYVLSSNERLSKDLKRDYLDLKNELIGKGIEFNILIMKEELANEQHERFMFDNKNAYKIPPFNIINKKSEHIVPMPLDDAKLRYDELSKEATKLDNLQI